MISKTNICLGYHTKWISGLNHMLNGIFNGIFSNKNHLNTINCKVIAEVVVGLISM